MAAHAACKVSKEYKNYGNDKTKSFILYNLKMQLSNFENKGELRGSFAERQNKGQGDSSPPPHK